MNNQFLEHAGVYAAEVQVAYVRAGFVGVLVALGWLLFPFAVQTVLHPGDAIRLQYVLQGQHVPHALTAQQTSVGLVEALFALGVLVMFQLVGTVLFYRRARLTGAQHVAAPALWILAALSAGVLGNAAWFVGTGYFDPAGFVVGFTSAALTVGGEMLCEQLGRDFVFGPASGQHPEHPQQLIAYSPNHLLAPPNHNVPFGQQTQHTGYPQSQPW
jgi:hypothetical protein